MKEYSFKVYVQAVGKEDGVPSSRSEVYTVLEESYIKAWNKLAWILSNQNEAYDIAGLEVRSLEKGTEY